MLLSFAKLEINGVSFRTDIGHHGRITVKPFIGSWNAFLFGLWIVHGGYVNIHGYQTVGKGCRLYPVCQEHIDILFQDSFAERIADIIHTLAQSFLRRDGAGNAKGGFIKVLVIIHLMYCFEIRLAHTQHAQVGQDNIAILDLVLWTIGCDIHPIELFNKIAFTEDRTDNSQTTGRNDAFISEFNDNVLFGVQRDPAIIIHGKWPHRKSFDKSILPCDTFTWQVNDYLRQKHTINTANMGFYEPLKKSTSRIQVINLTNHMMSLERGATPSHSWNSDTSLQG